MAEAPSRPARRSIVAAVVLGNLPVGLWFVLNYLRPDLLAPMLAHELGYLISVAELALTSLGLVTYVVLVTARPGSRKMRISLTIGAALLFTLPALLMVLFGPIVFVFMYGNLPPQ